MSSADAPIYLNNAASAWPRAEGVVDAVQRALVEPPSHPGRTTTTEMDAPTRCRRALAAMLGVDTPERIVLTSHATHALNLAILGIGLQAGDRVVTSVTEHNSVLRPLHHLRERPGIEVDVVGLDEDGNLDAVSFGAALSKLPRLVVLNHASNVTGRVNDVAPLLAKARAHGAVTLLDASQTLGHIPVNAAELCADMVAITGHKGLRGPTGTGALYVTEGLCLRQVYVGGTGVRSDLELHPPDMPMRLEAGTPNVAALAGLAAALEWHQRDGVEFARAEHALAHELRAGLRASPGVHVYDTAPDERRVGIVSFTIDSFPLEDATYVLAESFGIICRCGLHCAPLIHAEIGSAPEGTIRFSVSGANTQDEITAAIDAVRKLAA